jgi:hypothetical protein
MIKWTVKYRLNGRTIFHETVEATTMWNAFAQIRKKHPHAKLIGAVKEN